MRDHWKISVVQSPFCRRTSWARAGPSGRSEKSTKKSRSTSIPPSRVAIHAQQPGAQLRVELVVPGRVERVGDVEATAVERELDHLRPAAELAAGVAGLAEHTAEPQLPREFRVAGVGDVVLAQVAVEPVGEVEEAVVHREDDVGDQAGDRERPSLEVDALDGDDLLRRPAAVRALPVTDRAGERCAAEAALGVRVVLPAHLERYQPVLAQVDGLLQRALGEVPEVETTPVAAGLDVCEVEALLVGVRLAELRGDEHVLPRLVPEVVVEPWCLATVLPAALAARSVCASSTANPPAPLPSASPSMETTTLSPGMQWTVCGRV